MSNGQIKIWVNGKPDDTKIAVVDSDGKETKLLVEGISFDLPCADRGNSPGWLKLNACVGNSISIELPAEGEVVQRLVELVGGDAVRRQFSDIGRLRAALRQALTAWRKEIDEPPVVGAVRSSLIAHIEELRKLLEPTL